MVGELTQVIRLDWFLKECALSDANVQTVLDLCLPIELTCTAWAYPQEHTEFDVLPLIVD